MVWPEQKPYKHQHAGEEKILDCRCYILASERRDAGFNPRSIAYGPPSCLATQPTLALSWDPEWGPLPEAISASSRRDGLELKQFQFTFGLRVKYVMLRRLRKTHLVNTVLAERGPTVYPGKE